jgi:hypothetical protein
MGWLGPTLAKAYLMHKRGEIAMMKSRDPDDDAPDLCEAY